MNGTARDSRRQTLMLAAARLRHVASTKWATRPYMDMKRLVELDAKNEANVGGAQSPREEVAAAPSVA